MDLKIFFLILFVLYVLPELLKLGKKKKTPLPQAPKRLDGKPEMVKGRPVSVQMSSGMPPEPTTASFLTQRPPALPATPAPKQDEVLPSVAQDVAWSGKMDQTALINAVMYAEILDAPRAIKPFRVRVGNCRNR